MVPFRGDFSLIRSFPIVCFHGDFRKAYSGVSRAKERRQSWFPFIYRAKSSRAAFEMLGAGVA